VGIPHAPVVRGVAGRVAQGVRRGVERVAPNPKLEGEQNGVGRMGLLLSALVAVLALAGLGAFVSWRQRALARVRSGSEIVETARGVVEFARAGTGPVILHFHGGASGYDQTLALSWDLHEAGFTLLTPSRPGYLRTPLATGAEPEQAADAVAALLDVL